MRYITICLSILFVGGICSLIGGCGKKGQPTTPYNAPSHFPQTYPPLEEEEEGVEQPEQLFF